MKSCARATGHASVALAGLFICFVSGACQAQAIASLLRVTVDGRPADASHARSYGVETVLLRHLQERGFDNVDLSPLHADFQKLRYTRQCPVVDGDATVDDCAEFGNYAEAVLHAIDSIRMGVAEEQLRGLGDGDSILIGELRVTNAQRSVRAELHYRLYDFSAPSRSWGDDHEQDLRISSKATREGVTSELFDRLIERAALTIAEK